MPTVNDSPRPNLRRAPMDTQATVIAVLAGFQAIVLAFQVFISMKYLDLKQTQKDKSTRQAETLKRLARGGGSR
jgi:hypothetical protein